MQNISKISHNGLRMTLILCGYNAYIRMLYNQNLPLNDDTISKLSDTDLLDALCRQFGDYIHSIVFYRLQGARLNEDDIEECYCWVVLQLSEKGCDRLRKFRGASSFKTYLTVTCTRLVVDYLRSMIRRDRHEELVDDFNESGHGSSLVPDEDLLNDNPEILFITHERESLVKRAVEAVRGAVNRLDDFDRLIFRLRVEDRRSYKEIDEFLGVNNSPYLFKKVVGKLQSAVDEGMRREIEELLAEA